MHKLTDLAGGIAGAEGGYAEVYQRGTTTRAQCYNDFEGTDPVTKARYSLDEYGRRILYVNELVTVVPYDSSGAVLDADFVAGVQASAVEYTGTGFTGTDYSSGAEAAGEPLTAKEIFDLWYTKAGATDWDIQKDVADTPATWDLKSLGVTIGTAFVNVKDPDYGAKGNGVTDDTTAIQGAIDAVEAAGGGMVLIPPGTYKVTGALTIDSAGVVVQGFGNPIIQTTSTSANVFTCTANNTGLDGFRIEVATAAGADSTGYGISMAGVQGFFIRNVRVSYVSTTYVFARGIRLSACVDGDITDCGVNDANVYGLRMESNCASISVVGGFFSAFGTTAGEAISLNAAVEIALVGIHYIYGGSAGYAVRLVASTQISLTGANVYTDAGTGTSLGVDTNSYIRESACTFGDATPIITIAAPASGHSVVTSVSRMGANVASIAALVLPNPGAHELYTITGTADITSIAVAGWRPGSRVTLLFSGNAATTGVTDGSNLVLAGNFAYTTSDTLSLITDGTNWIETSRSVN